MEVEQVLHMVGLFEVGGSLVDLGKMVEPVVVVDKLPEVDRQLPEVGRQLLLLDFELDMVVGGHQGVGNFAQVR